MLDGARQDLRQACRSLARRPGLAGAAIATLALGLGASTAIFSVAYGVSLRPLPYPEPAQLVRVYESNPANAKPRENVSVGTFHEWREGVESFSSARLRPGATIEQARSGLEATSARLARDFPTSNDGWTATVESLHDATAGAFARAAWLLVAAVAVVLLVTCLHVAGLLVARAAAGWPETAIRVFTSRVVAAFGTLALLLAAVGIYGTLSYLVGARTREIGIRLALGASRRGIRSTVLWRGSRPRYAAG